MFVLLTAAAALARSYDADSPRFATADGGMLVLEHTAVDAEVQLGLAVVTVRQEFHNPYDHPIDATYLFPLPPDAAVRAMSMTCGDRRIDGELLGREEARARYAAAAAEGRKAALLEQERPNLFRQSVASLCPGEDVTVELQYADPLVVEDGRRELVFPTTVGPRYRPGDVPEPPFVTLPAHTVDVHVTIDEGLGVESLWSDSHPIDIDEGDGRVEVRTADDELPNVDFHLAWTFAGPRTRIGAVVSPAGPSGEEGYVGLTIEPALLEDLGAQRGRELLFVLDESCSMSGEPFAAEVAAVRLALAKMRPDDTFNLVRFSNEASSLFAAPSRATPENVALAESWLQVFDGGGTEMTAGIVHSLDMPGDPERLRLVLLLTDGYIGDEQHVLDAVRAHLGRARLFSLGVGSAVNRALLDALALEGRGDVAYHLPGTPVSDTVDRFYARIAHPAWTDLSIDWGGLVIDDIYPTRLPDVFAGQPVRIVARYHGTGSGVVRVSGRAAGAEYTLTRPLDLDGAPEHEALEVLWARRKIADLERTLRDPAVREAEVTAIALAHHLVSDSTSLVATERAPSSCGPSAVGQVEVPSMLPEGVAGVGTSGALGLGGGASGFGSGGGHFGVKGEGGIGTVGDAVILGSLDRSVIDRVVRQNLNAVRYCYQRELSRTPTLRGKVVIRFTVAADGTVTEATVASSTLGSAEVDACVAARFQRMRFSAVPGGGTIVVSYPITFAPE